MATPDASEVPTLSFGFNTNAGHEITAAYMQDQWSKNLGIKSELKGVTFDTFVVERPKLVYALARNAWGADYPHPDNFLRALFGSKSGNNDEGYNNPAFDDLVAKAGAETDPTKALALYNQAQELLVEDAPAVFTRWRVSNYEVEPWVKGVTGTGQDSVVIGDLFYENIQHRQALGAQLAPRERRWDAPRPTPRPGPSIVRRWRARVANRSGNAR